MSDDIDYRGLLLQFIASLTLCDHMGDVSSDVEEVLRRLGLKIDWDDGWHQLSAALGKMGITTLNGTSFDQEDEDEP